MALHHAEPGEIIDLANFQQGIAPDVSTALFRTDEVEVIKRVLHAGQVVPAHEVRGDMTLQCLSGTAKLEAFGKTQSIRPGELTYISACEPYALSADEDTVILMTIVRAHEAQHRQNGTA